MSVPEGGTSIALPSPPSDVQLPPYARRLDVRATRAAFAAGTLSTVGDHTAREDVQRNIEVRHTDGYDANVMHAENLIEAKRAALLRKCDETISEWEADVKCGWTEADRQAFLRRAQYVDPRERRA